MSSKLDVLVNRHVNHWFHHERFDGGSPAITLKKCNEMFLAKIRRMRLDLFCEDAYFRKSMCEAVCTIYMSEKEGTRWAGPHSNPPRPNNWSSRREQSWREYRDYHYLNSDFWVNFWSTIQEGLWEGAIPHWRTAYQNIAGHYINVETDNAEDICDDVAAKTVDKMEEDVLRRPIVKQGYESD